MPLSPNESKVLALFDQGKSYKQIAAQLQISESTVRTYCYRIIAKTFTVEMLVRASLDAEKNLRGAAYIRRQLREK